MDIFIEKMNNRATFAAKRLGVPIDLKDLKLVDTLIVLYKLCTAHEDVSRKAWREDRLTSEKNMKEHIRTLAQSLVDACPSLEGTIISDKCYMRLVSDENISKNESHLT